MLTLRVLRKSESLSPKRNPEFDDWANNDKNNSLDVFEIFDSGKMIFSCKVQSVSNIPGGRYGDTLAAGKFQLRLFVEQRLFWPRIHGIINAFDLEGQQIDDRSIQPVKGKRGEPIDFNRWLLHDTQKLKPTPQNIRTRVAWSAGCLIVSPEDLLKINALFERHGLKAGDVLEGEIIQL